MSVTKQIERRNNPKSMPAVLGKDLTVIWSFRNRSDALCQSLASAHKTCGMDVRFMMVDAASNDKETKKIRCFCSDHLDERIVKICESHKRTTLCEAWNIGMYLSDTRYVIFSSSDVNFKCGGWADEIAYWFNIGKEYVMLENHAVFGFDKAAVPKMGWFDEGFGNGPHFDTDFMIRASEAGVSIRISRNAYYHHLDSYDETKDRLTKDCADRLPMNDFSNEKHFMSKWQSDWPGWQPQIMSGEYVNLAHPPTHISHAQRIKKEIDWHPSWTKAIRREYCD